VEKFKNSKINLGVDASFKGVMTFEKPLKIAGHYEGTIESSSFLQIENGAELKADIKVENVIVGGTVYGDIYAEQSLLLLSTGKVFGNVFTTSLQVEDGFELTGKCEMIKDLISVDIFSTSLPQLKKTLIDGIE
jgi:cytoskeletal protein CcmA (bactofilin family)